MQHKRCEVWIACIPSFIFECITCSSICRTGFIWNSIQRPCNIYMYIMNEYLQYIHLRTIAHNNDISLAINYKKTLSLHPLILHSFHYIFFLPIDAVQNSKIKKALQMNIFSTINWIVFMAFCAQMQLLLLCIQI